MDTVANKRQGRSSEDIMFNEINPAPNREGRTMQTEMDPDRETAGAVF